MNTLTDAQMVRLIVLEYQIAKLGTKHTYIPRTRELEEHEAFEREAQSESSDNERVVPETLS